MEERRQDYPDLIKKIDNIDDTVQNILRILNGNGEEGLVAKVIEHDKTLNLYGRINFFIIITILGGIITTFMGLIFIKIGIKP